MFENQILSTLSKSIVEDYDIAGELELLYGEVDYNYLLKSTTENFLVKVSPKINFTNSVNQARALEHISESKDKQFFHIARLIRNNRKELISTVEFKNNTYKYWLQSWIPGIKYFHFRPKSNRILKELGKAAAHLQKALSKFEMEFDPQKKHYKWDLNHAEWIEEHMHLLTKETRSHVSLFLKLFKKNKTVYRYLAKCTIHNDLNDYNILVQNNGKIGFIDFGDMVYSQRINDLAILLAYAIIDLKDPVDGACILLQAYHRESPLSDKEIHCLFPLIGMRLSVSLVNAALNRFQIPENEYLFVSEKPAKKLIALLALEYEYIELRLKSALTTDISPARIQFDHWIKNHPESYGKVCPLEIGAEDYLMLDLNVASTELGHEYYYNNPYTHHAQIQQLLHERKKNFAIGMYNEIRPLYSSDAFSEKGNNGHRWRTVHIGLDFFSRSGTEVYSFAEGTVYALSNNVGDKNYGHTIILEHKTENGFTFYTLYGHLSSSIHSHLKLGQQVKKGEQIAWFGEPYENGNWAPHLHFQIILHLFNNTSDYPGVCRIEERNLYNAICPDPSPIFKLEVEKSKSLTTDQILSKRSKYLGKSYSLSYSKPLHIVRGAGVYLYDQNGRKYLDCVNNVPHVGHQNIDILKALKNQSNLLNTNTRYLHENIVLFAEKLLQKCPEQISNCHLVNSGSEANELAIRMARTTTGRKDILVMEHGYHGNTNTCIDISHYKFNRKGGLGKKSWVHVLEVPDPVRKFSQGKSDDDILGRNIQLIDSLIKAGKRPAALIAESVLSCGGQLYFPELFLKKLYRACKERDILLIADEVQTGLGRLGDFYWAFEMDKLIPDIISIGKPIGNGHPLGVVLCTDHVAEHFNNGMEYFNTFGGNPVSCAIGLAVLEYIEQNKLQSKARNIGNYVKEGFEKIKSNQRFLADVRGAGLFLGIEFADPETTEPLPEQAKYFVNRAKHLGILLNTDGPFNNVIKFKPPMVFSRKNADYLLHSSQCILEESYYKK